MNPLRLVGQICLSALLAGGAWSQAPAPAAQGGYRVAGRVLDAVSGEPVRRATVSLLSRQYEGLAATGVTDNEGRFSFENVPAGKYPLTAAKRGYLTRFYDEHEGFNCAIVTGPGLDTTNLQFHIPPQAVLHGVVSGDGGDPIEQAEVMLFKRPEHAGEKMRQMESAQTDDTGAYEFTRLEAGDYQIAVRAQPWFAQHGAGARDAAQEQSPLDVAYPLTFYDSTVDENVATPLRLDAGSREEADINLHSLAAVRIKEPEQPRNRRPSPMLLRQRVFGEIVEVPTQQTQTAGGRAWELVGVAPGNYEVQMGNPPRTLSLNAAADVDLEKTDGTPTVTVTVTVVMPDHSQAPDRTEIMIEPDERQGAPIPARMRSGNFEFEGVAPGTWVVHAASGGKTLPVIGISMGGSMTAGNQFLVKDQPVSITVTVARGQTSVIGFAKKDGKPAAGVLVALVPRAASAYKALARFDEADFDGSFSLNDVPPGDYIIVAVEDGWKLDRDRRGQIARYLPRGVAVSIREQTTGVFTLREPVIAVPR